jgi:hypothetical protein
MKDIAEVRLNTASPLNEGAVRIEAHLERLDTADLNSMFSRARDSKR